MLVCFALNEMGKSKASGTRVDWTCSPRNALFVVETSLYKVIFDPSRLFLKFQWLRKWFTKWLTNSERQIHRKLRSRNFTKYSVDHAKAFIDAVKDIKINICHTLL
jgi:uroporphyrinogen decarboxylase